MLMGLVSLNSTSTVECLEKVWGSGIGAPFQTGLPGDWLTFSSESRVTGAWLLTDLRTVRSAAIWSSAGFQGLCPGWKPSLASWDDSGFICSYG